MVVLLLLLLFLMNVSRLVECSELDVDDDEDEVEDDESVAVVNAWPISSTSE